ncbi:hypothetical protein CLOM_g16162 [Closterium sp. NIES-68]|nr:hypothetical protein CLOM_g16162 [Closterium sp. NIES-68]
MLTCRDWRDAVVAEERDAGGAGGRRSGGEERVEVGRNWREGKCGAWGIHGGRGEVWGEGGERGNTAEEEWSELEAPNVTQETQSAATAAAATPSSSVLLPPPSSPVAITVIKVDNTLLLLGTSHGQLQVWHLPSHSLLTSLFHPHPLPITSLTLSESLGDPPRVPQPLSHAATGCACNEDGCCASHGESCCACNEDGWRLVASAAADGSVRVWSLPRWPTANRPPSKVLQSEPQVTQAGANEAPVPAGATEAPPVPAGQPRHHRYQQGQPRHHRYQQGQRRHHRYQQGQRRHQRYQQGQRRHHRYQQGQRRHHRYQQGQRRHQRYQQGQRRHHRYQQGQRRHHRYQQGQRRHHRYQQGHRRHHRYQQGHRSGRGSEGHASLSCLVDPGPPPCGSWKERWGRDNCGRT